ncbi:hypothetical protein [Curtobacterium sp. 1310]|uniref:hypothetical protein n=1 Tax=Curtobacterium sp. 1310 TaxID=2806570 RepID=UPI001AEA3588|nr:hypothetical protein [Curtobacterium sp. 1310]MBP1301442.1 hypothetical protein [Curtobacterium sp. 1310]
MNFLWSTRGRTWGFRFLHTAGVANPLAVYEEAFAGTQGMPETFRRRDRALAVRFPDPDGRTDRAGRVIPHEFVVLAPDNTIFQDADAARQALWDEVRDPYAAVWAQSSPPASGLLG